MTLISKIAGTLGISTCVYDMHKSGMIEARRNSAKAGVNSFLSNEINTMKTDECSFKNTQIKNWKARNNIFQPIHEVFAGITGYIKGFLTAGIKYIPNFIAATVAIACKNNKKAANIAAGVLAVMEGWNFFKNTSGINQKNDYLNM